MRRLFIPMLIAAGLTLVGVSSFALTEQHTKQVAAEVAESANITGAITEFKGDTLTVKDQAGQTHSVKAADPKALEGLEVGDNVNVKMGEEGTAASIEKIESEAPAEGAPAE